VIRPMLPVLRREVMGYLKRQKLSSCEDASNASLEYTRNRIRHTLIPVLEKFNPRMIEHLFSLSQIVGQENSFLDRVSARAIKRTVSREQNLILLDLKRFLRYNKIIQLRVLKGILPEKRSRFHVERVYQWLSSSQDCALRFSGTWGIERKDDTLIFRNNRTHESKGCDGKKTYGRGPHHRPAAAKPRSGARARHIP
jgi:tRNA(Ile)-lysidine synthase